MYRAYKSIFVIVFLVISISLFLYTFDFSFGSEEITSDPESTMITTAAVTGMRPLPSNIWIPLGVFVVIVIITGLVLKKLDKGHLIDYGEFPKDPPDDYDMTDSISDIFLRK